MPSLISATLMGLVLGVLALMPDIKFGETFLTWLVSPSSFSWLSLALMLVVFLGVRMWRCRRIPRILTTLMCCFIIGLLFVLRSMMAYVQFEQHTISQSLTVTAIAFIEEISDGIYDPVLGSSYRQKAIITGIKPVANIQDANATVSINPFGGESELVIADVAKLPSTMNVLLSASPKYQKNNQSLLRLNSLTPNTIVKLTLLIEPLSMQKNTSGFDGNAWLRTRNIHATARVLSVDKISTTNGNRIGTKLQGLRQQFRMYFYENWDDYDIDNQQARAVTLSLLTGDRSLIDKQTKDLYQLAGISHLLAISGTHVLFLALILASLSSWLVDRCYPKLYMTASRKQIRLIIMVVASLAYAMFTGFDVPAVRTVYMLGVMALVRYLVLPVSNMSVLFVVALIMMWLNPYVLCQAGFWLSFVAVILLMRHEDAIIQEVSIWSKAWQNIKKVAILQFWLFIGMLPVSILFFGKVSLWGVLVNLFAIGLFGLIILPINLLAGIIYIFSPSIASGLWILVSWILLKLHTAFELSLIGDSWFYTPFGMLGIMLIALSVLPIITKALPKSAAIVPLSVLLLLSINGYFYTSKDVHPTIKIIKTNDQSLQVVLIQHRSYSWLLLSDFGVKSLSDGQARTLIDGLRRMGVRHLTGVIAQNSSQSLSRLVGMIDNRLPIDRYWRAGRGGLKLANVIDEPCQAGQVYQYGDVNIRMLTGWQQIEDVKVWDCTIEVSSEEGFVIDQSMDTKNDDVLPGDVKQVIVNAAKHDDVWQLWRRLCADMNIMPRTETSNVSMWFSHGSAKNNADIIGDFNAILWQDGREF